MATEPQQNDERILAWVQDGIPLITRVLATATEPTTVRVNGYCVGGRLAIATETDIRYRSDISTFSVPAAKRGIGDRLEGIRDLASLFVSAFKSETFDSGQQFHAGEARNLGLVDRMVSQADLDSATSDLVGRIARNGPLTIKADKQALIELDKPEVDWDLGAPETAVALCRTSYDTEEAGAPSWKSIAHSSGGGERRLAGKYLPIPGHSTSDGVSRIAK